MVLPELSRTMAYTTRNTVNRLARKELYKSCGTILDPRALVFYQVTKEKSSGVENAVVPERSKEE